MEINNDLRRTKIKLELLNQEGVFWLIEDFFKKTTISPEIISRMAKDLEARYKHIINENSPKGLRQKTIFEE